MSLYLSTTKKEKDIKLRGCGWSFPSMFLFCLHNLYPGELLDANATQFTRPGWSEQWPRLFNGSKQKAATRNKLQGFIILISPLCFSLSLVSCGDSLEIAGIVYSCYCNLDSDAVSTKGHVLAVRKGRLMSPSTFTALSGDLHVQIQFNGNEMSSQAEEEHTIGGGPSNEEPLSSSDGLKSRNNTIMSTLVISKIIDEVESPLEKGLTPGPEVTNTSQVVLHRKRKEVVQNIPLFPDPRFNVTQVTVPCQTFLIGGRYEMQVVSNLKSVNRSEVTTTLVPAQDERLHQTLDVRWPSAEMIVSPVRLKTYPKHPVEVTLRFPEVNCNQSGSLALPEFWLELIYCGKDRSCNRNITPTSVLFAEQIRGFPKNKSLHLGCELFGLAGNYAVQLRPMIPAQNVPTTRRLLSVDWSDEFVFNVYARSIFPCDPHTGIGVLYEYPGCILEQGDRVRLYARLRADVASLKPPTSLHYVSEQRVVKSQHSLYFACEHFSEKYVEYCFVYVSQAISGAVADVRMDCVPTLPVSGEWSMVH